MTAWFAAAIIAVVLAAGLTGYLYLRLRRAESPAWRRGGDDSGGAALGLCRSPLPEMARLFHPIVTV